MPNYASVDQLPPQHREQAAAEIARQERERPSRGPGSRPVVVAKGGKPVTGQGNPYAFRYEHDLQVAVFNWAETAVTDIPELEMLYAIPNGGHRTAAAAGKMKAEGQKAGVWDICLDVARGGYHTLKIELKVGKNTLTEAQQVWGTKYARHGHKTAVCRDLESAQAVIVEYLSS